MLHELHAQGVSISAIARQTGLDRKTVRRHLAAGTQAPVYGPRTPQGSLLNRFTVYLQTRLDQYPGLSGARCQCVACHPLLTGRGQRRLAPGHWQPRKIAPASLPPTYSGYFTRPGEVVAERDLSVYQRIGQAKTRETHT